MATASTNSPFVCVEEYLARFVDGDEKPSCEYIDGDLIAKPLPTRQHSQVRGNIAYLIRVHYSDSANPLPELTTRLRDGHFLVPDLAIEDLSHPITGRYPGPKEPVLLCVEILSPTDRVVKLFAKCEEYHRWGVPYCWVIDPDRKIAWEYFPHDVEPRKVEGTLTAGTIQLQLDEVFHRV